VEVVVAIAEVKVILRPDVLYRDLEGEAVLLDLQSGKYYGLNTVGSRLWFLLAENDSLARAYQIILDEYAVTPEQLEKDLLELIEKLAAVQLLTIESVKTP
jgi:hypothetical protein